MSISKFAVDYHKKDEGGHYEDYDYGTNLKKKVKKQKTEEKVEVKMDDNFQKSLPIELILEFLSRLPVNSLTRLSCASKYLYNYINQNQQFTKSHFINYSQKNPILVFYINYYGTEKQQQLCLLRNLFHARDIEDDRNDNYDVDLSKTITLESKGEFVGYCNGLICFRQMFNKIGCLFDVWNYTTKEFLRIVPPVIGGGIYYKIRSSGFGFDSINNEYKLVIIVNMLETKSPKCLVYTFGIKSSWTEVRSPDSGLLLTSSYGATGGAGALFWRTSDPQVILLFDLHEDKLQYIRIPVERNAVKQLFEHKESFVVAILQKKSLLVEGINTKTAHTLEKVHLKILKAYKDDQVWDKETIDLWTYSIPFSDNFRFVSFSGQILLYWADPKSFQFFNLHTKCLKVVKNICSGMSKKRLPRAAGAKDYWLNCEVENICSLKTLLPLRAQKSDRAALNSMMDSFQNMWTLQQPSTTVGGFFCSYYQSKTSEYYFFDD